MPFQILGETRRDDGRLSVDAPSSAGGVVAAKSVLPRTPERHFRAPGFAAVPEKWLDSAQFESHVIRTSVPTRDRCLLRGCHYISTLLSILHIFLSLFCGKKVQCIMVSRVNVLGRAILKAANYRYSYAVVQ